MCLLIILALGGCSSGQEEFQKPFRLEKPRIAPLAEDQRNQKQAELLTPFKNDDGKILNVLTTLASHPELFERFVPFATIVPPVFLLKRTDNAGPGQRNAHSPDRLALSG